MVGIKRITPKKIAGREFDIKGFPDVKGTLGKVSKPPVNPINISKSTPLTAQDIVDQLKRRRPN